MRWFWLFIASLTLLTAVLYTTRVRAERAQQAALQAQAEQDAPNTATRRSRDRASRSDRQSRPERQSETTPQPDPQPDPQPEASAQSDTQTEGQSGSQPESQPETRAPAQPPPQPEEPVRDEPLETAADTPQSPAFDPTALVNAFKEAESQRTTEPEPDGSDRVVDDGQAQPIAQTARSDAETQTGTQPEAQSNQQTPAQSESQTQAQPEADALGQALAQAARENSGTQPDPGRSEEPTAAKDDAPRSYELRPDGSFRVIEQDVWVQGAGTAAEPYVLSWDVLKTVEKSYDPRNGKETIPDWLDHLDGKVVQIEGNTLVPVVATTTRELLVMQNPWDGCCIGVPPTPYDAVEVVLNHDVDFGNSAVGFGSVLGTFYLDPYIVDGWVLGLYIIEDAKYRSGEGVEFPQF